MRLSVSKISNFFFRFNVEENFDRSFYLKSVNWATVYIVCCNTIVNSIVTKKLNTPNIFTSKTFLTPFGTHVFFGINLKSDF